MTQTPCLAAIEVTKAYGDVLALSDVHFQLRPGEVQALVGENGAGKSTLVKILTGAVAPDRGQLQRDGRPVRFTSPRDARAAGVAVVHQHPALLPDLTVAENLALAGEASRPWSRVRWGERRARARTLLAQVGARLDPDTLARELTPAEQQLVELARALAGDCQVLILDEPTAALSAREVTRLFEIVERLKAAQVALVYVSHRLDEVRALADRVTVLRDGRMVGTHPMSDLDDAALLRLMAARTVAPVRRTSTATTEPALVVRGLSSARLAVRPAHLQVGRGEILGLGGLVGAGRSELARLIAGLEPADAGEIELRGRVMRPRTPADAIAAGLAYLPEDRRRHGVIGELSIADNVGLASLRGWWANAAREQRQAELHRQRLGIKARSVDVPVGTLSGGNQQKVALARWLETSPDLLILDEPTQGVDVAAKAEIHNLIGELAASGRGILLISSDLPELLALSDRVAVMRSGEIVGTLPRESATAEAVLALAFGTGVADAA